MGEAKERELASRQQRFVRPRVGPPQVIDFIM
jgi:hypothetical protein